MLRLGVFVSLMGLALTSHAGEKLLFAADLVRHGDRTPLHDFPKAPHHWKLSTGTLTPEGMHQAYTLGQAFRKTYVQEANLLPKQYKASLMTVRSTDVDRTLMTATSLLYGFYPLGTGPQLNAKHAALPKKFQPIPIHTKPVSTDHLLRVPAIPDTFETRCLELSKPAEKTLQKWEQVTGLPLQHCKDILELGDTIKVRALYHVPLPKGLSQEEAARLMTLSETLTTEGFKTLPELKKTGFNYIRHVLNNMMQVQQNKLKQKYKLFVAHDYTILSVMSALEIPLDRMPEYVANFRALLIQDKEQVLVRFLLNNQALRLPYCQKQDCTLAELSKHFDEPLIPS